MYLKIILISLLSLSPIAYGRPRRYLHNRQDIVAPSDLPVGSNSDDPSSAPPSDGRVFVGDAGASPPSATPSPSSLPPDVPVTPDTTSPDPQPDGAERQGDQSNSTSTSTDADVSSSSSSIDTGYIPPSTSPSPAPTTSPAFASDNSTTMTITPAPSTVSPTPTAQFIQEHPPNLSGPPNSFSQTHTTLQGVATDLPVWFNKSGAAIIVVPVVPILALSIPSPGLGFPDLSIGEDGQAHKAEEKPDKQNSTPLSSMPSSSTQSRSSSSLSSDLMRPTPWLLFPTDRQDAAANDQITTDLQTSYGKDRVSIVRNPFAQIEIFYWRAPLTDADVESYSRRRQISSVQQDQPLPEVNRDLDTGSQYKRRGSHDAHESKQQFDGDKAMLSERRSDPEGGLRKVYPRQEELTAQSTSFDPILFPELAQVSQLPLEVGNGLIDKPTTYFYHPSAGKGTTVYFHDGGIALDHQDFGRVRSNARIIETNIDQAYGYQQVFGLQGLTSHGTAVASKAVGVLLGVAKKADLVFVNQPAYIDPDSHRNESLLTFATSFEAFHSMIRDMSEHQSYRGSVINLSYGILPPRITSDSKFWQSWHDLLLQVLDNEIVVVVSAGNDPEDKNSPVNQYPALFGSLPEFAGRLLVVGSTTSNGALSLSSRTGPAVNVWAQGQDVQLAYDLASNAYMADTGTSFAAPVVAGLAAYLLAHPSYQTTIFNGGPKQTVTNLVNLIKRLSRPIAKNGGPPVVYNGEDWLIHCPYLTMLQPGSKRDAGSRACVWTGVQANDTEITETFQVPAAVPDSELPSGWRSATQAPPSSTPSQMQISSTSQPPSSPPPTSTPSPSPSSSQISTSSSSPLSIPSSSTEPTSSKIPASSLTPGPVPSPSPGPGPGPSTDPLQPVSQTASPKSPQCDCLRNTSGCRVAGSQWTDTYNYTGATIYTFTPGPRQVLQPCEQQPNNGVLGCSASYSCPKHELYGLTGAQINNIIDPYLSLGSTVISCSVQTLANGCTLTTQPCVDCKDTLPKGAPAPKFRSGGPNS